MKWRPTLAAIQISSAFTDTVVHVVDRYQVDTYLRRPPHQHHYSVHGKVQTYCGCEVDLRNLDARCERQETDVNCEQCMAQVEKRQAFWDQFWRSPEGVEAIKILTGYNRLEQKQREMESQIEALLREVTALNNLITSCLAHKEPVFILELPDEVLLKLADYKSVGEVLLLFKLDVESRQRLETELGKVGFSLLGSRLLSKGYLKPTDPVFRNW